MTTANTPATQTQKSVTKFDPDRGGLQLTNSSQMWEMAQFFARSELVPQCYQGKPANILVAWQKGAEIGFSPTMALDSIAVINGRASVWGEGATALVLASGLCEKHSLTYHGTGDNLVARCTVKRKGMDAESFEFGVADAKLAGLWGKGTYKSYPRDMLGWKAKARAYRSQFADCLKGIMLREDMEGGLNGRRFVSNTAPADPPENPQTDPALDDLLGEAEEVVDAEYEAADDATHHHQQGEGGEDYDSDPLPRWEAIAQDLAQRCDCTMDEAIDKIGGFAGRVYKADVSELTDTQLDDLAAKVEQGDIKV